MNRDPESVHTVLFLCTGNSARSILAEAILNRIGTGRWCGLSAGSHPRGRVHPIALELLREHGEKLEGFRSKSWDEFAGPSAPGLDLVITVCDDAADEQCPLWLGHPVTAHWGLPDPAAASPETRRTAFEQTWSELERRIRLLTNLTLDGLEPDLCRARIEALGRPIPAGPKESPQ